MTEFVTEIFGHWFNHW